MLPDFFDFQVALKQHLYKGTAPDLSELGQILDQVSVSAACSELFSRLVTEFLLLKNINPEQLPTSNRYFLEFLNYRKQVFREPTEEDQIWKRWS